MMGFVLQGKDVKMGYVFNVIVEILGVQTEHVPEISLV